jgi:hypothetical protein
MRDYFDASGSMAAAMKQATEEWDWTNLYIKIIL